MRSYQLSKAIPVVIAGSMLLALVGCKDDGPAAPQVPSGVAADPRATTALLAVDFGNRIGSLLPQWWNGDLAGASKAAPIWDAGTMTWLFGIEMWDESVLYPSSAGVTGSVQLRYFANGEAQQSAVGAEYLAILIMMHVAENSFQDEDNNRTLTADFIVEMIVAENSPGVFGLTAAGSGDVGAYVTLNGEFSENFYADIMINWDIAVPTGGCPDGSFSLSHQQTVFMVNFDGSAELDWSVNLPAGGLTQGTEDMGCDE